MKHFQRKHNQDKGKLTNHKRGVTMEKVKVSWAVLLFVGAVIYFQGVLVNQVLATENKQYPEAQAVIDKMIKKYPELVRLTIHAVPTGQESSELLHVILRKKSARHLIRKIWRQ